MTFSLLDVNTAIQHVKKGESDSPGLVDFATGLTNSVLNLLHGQVKFVQITKEKLKTMLLIKTSAS